MTVKSTGRWTHARWTVGTLIAVMVTLASLLVTAGRTRADEPHRNELAFNNPAGVVGTLTTADSFDERNPFFQVLGTNGRSCATCHQPSQAWSVTPGDPGPLRVHARPRSDLPQQRRLQL
jgi:hypothetical protein